MALPASTHSAPTYSDINLVPLRVNVVSDDNNVSIVETLVLDRNCWPVPLFAPLEEAIQRNAAELAYMILSDLEVHGMGRTVRHFTGRIELFSDSLQKKIHQQLVPQLRHVARTTKLRIVQKKHKNLGLTGAASESSSVDDDEDNNKNNSSNKRKRDESSSTDEKQPAKQEDSSSKPSSTETKDDDTDNNSSNDEEDDEEKSNPPPSKPPTPPPSSPTLPPLKKKRVKKASLVPVRLRLCVNGVRIHDDFIWDLSVPQCPIEFAKSLGSDLNLSDEAVAAIVTSIVEQLDGSMVDDTKDLIDHPTTTSTSATTASSGSGRKKNSSAAWSLEHKVHLGNVQQLVTMHRATTTTTPTTATTGGTTTS